MAESQTVDGFWVASPPFTVHEKASLAEEELAQVVLEALANSSVGVPVPPRSETPVAPVLRLAGARSFSQFMSGARAVRIVATDDDVEVIPTRNAGARGGLSILVDQSVRASNDAASVETALETALAISR
jgi:hypothetical protein